MTLRPAFFPFQMLHFSMPISYPFLALSSRLLSAFFCIVCMYRQSLCHWLYYRWYASHFDIIMHILEPNQIHKPASADNIDCNVDCDLNPRLFFSRNAGPALVLAVLTIMVSACGFERRNMIPIHYNSTASFWYPTPPSGQINGYVVRQTICPSYDNIIIRCLCTWYVIVTLATISHNDLYWSRLSQTMTMLENLIQFSCPSCPYLPVPGTILLHNKYSSILKFIARCLVAVSGRIQLSYFKRLLPFISVSMEKRNIEVDNHVAIGIMLTRDQLRSICIYLYIQSRQCLD